MATSAEKSRTDERREALLEAAAEIFFAHGYAATSIDAIIERVGGSKRTIYSQFGNKAGLFTAIVSQNVDRALGDLVLEGAADQDLRGALTAFGVRMMETYMSPTTIGIYRTIVTEAQRYPELARDFYDIGPGKTSARLAQRLETAQAKGEVRAGDPLELAQRFVGMLRNDRHLEVVLGLRPPLSPAEIGQAVNSAVDLFLDGAHLTSP